MHKYTLTTKYTHAHMHSLPNSLTFATQLTVQGSGLLPPQLVGLP